MIYPLFAVAVGGAIGSMARFLISQKVNQMTGIAFPYGTLIVNVLGCLLIGFLSTVLIERFLVSVVWRAGILIGVLGGFTTFSSFSLDTFKLYEQGSFVAASLNVFLSVILCLSATLLGTYLGRNV